MPAACLPLLPGFVWQTTENEWGHAVVATALSVVDDTALTGKLILGELKVGAGCWGCWVVGVTQVASVPLLRAPLLRAWAARLCCVLCRGCSCVGVCWCGLLWVAVYCLVLLMMLTNCVIFLEHSHHGGGGHEATFLCEADQAMVVVVLVLSVTCRLAIMPCQGFAGWMRRPTVIWHGTRCAVLCVQAVACVLLPSADDAH